MLKGKACVVTGAGSGIGRASAIRFAREGGSVVCADVNEAGVAETTALASAAGSSSGLGGRALARTCDVSDASQVEALVEACCSEFGGIDVMYANAGIVAGGPFWTESAEDFERVFRVNVVGVFHCFKYAFLKMDAQGPARGGSLVATSSVAGVRSGAGDASYSSSKAAVITLCSVVANQCTGTGIRCNAVCPGIIGKLHS